MVGERSMGDARVDYEELAYRWFDYWLKGIDNGIEREPALRVWMQEAVTPAPQYESIPGRWVAEPIWPAPGIETFTFYLSANGCNREPGEAEEEGGLGARRAGAPHGPCVAGMGPEPAERARGQVDGIGPDAVLVSNAGVLVAEAVDEFLARFEAADVAEKGDMLREMKAQAAPDRLLAKQEVLCEAGVIVLPDSHPGDIFPHNILVVGDGSFAFPTPLADGSPYTVTVASEPAGQDFVVIDGAGAIAGVPGSPAPPTRPPPFRMWVSMRGASCMRSIG